MENRKHQQPIPEELKDEQLDAVAGGQDLTDPAPGMALPYFALAIMYEKTAIQQMEEADKLKEEERLRDAMNTRGYEVLSEMNAKLAEVNAMSVAHQTDTRTSTFPSVTADLSGML